MLDWMKSGHGEIDREVEVVSCVCPVAHFFLPPLSSRIEDPEGINGR